jgi:hypothetical protein
MQRAQLLRQLVLDLASGSQMRSFDPTRQARSFGPCNEPAVDARVRALPWGRN